MMGLLLQWLVLEHFGNLQHSHIACWCNNNTTMVAWATHLQSAKATNVAQVFHILALCMHACQSLPIMMQHIARELNTMADFM